MNTNILKKCIDKLHQCDTDPNAVTYVLGMLETLLEMQPPTVLFASKQIVSKDTTASPIKENFSDADILNKEAEERLKGIKDIA